MDCSVKIVVYAKNSGKKEFLLSKNEKGWRIIRGTVDRKEQPYTAGINEAKKATGISGFKRYEYLGEIHWDDGRSWDDVFSMFIEKQETRPGNGYKEQKWVGYAEALAMLTKESDKKVLRMVNSKPE